MKRALFWNLEPFASLIHEKERVMLLEIKDYGLVLRSRVTASVLAVLPQLEGRKRWVNGTELRAENTEHNVRVLRSIAGVQVSDVRRYAELVQGPHDEFDVGSAYLPKTEAFPHQKTALQKMEGKKAFALFMEQGTGKTKVVVDWAGGLFSDGKITGVLVVSKRGAHRQWIESEVPKHLSHSFDGAFWPFKKTKNNLDNPKTKFEWASFNYDALRSTKTLNVAHDFCIKHKGKLMLVLDESQEVKNYSSGRYKAVRKLSHFASFRVLSTGTPIAKNLVDEWSQLNLIDPNIIGMKYVSTFKSEFCIVGGFTGREVIGTKNIDKFKAITAPHVFRARKEELGLLPKQYSEWYFDLSPVQRKHIKEIRNDLLTQIDDNDVNVATAATALGKVQQVSNGFIINEDGAAVDLFPDGSNPRVNSALDWFSAGDGKAIIWCKFKHDIALMASAMRQKSISFVEYHGGTADNARKQAIDSFLDPSGAEILLANPQAAGTGLNLQGGCNRALYYSNGFNAIDRWQSEDRIHRIGTHGIVTYTDLLCKGSIDYHIMRNLRAKKGLSDLVLGDIRDWAADL